MAHIAADRVLETSTTTGTGALTLAGAITGFRTFASVMSTSDLCYYSLEAIDANGAPTGEWETGLGTYSGTNTLTRTTVIASSNSNAAVSLSAGTKRVMISPLSILVTPRLTRIQLQANASKTSSAFAAHSWGSSDIVQDDVTAWSSGAPTRITTPSGYTRVRVTVDTWWASNSAGQRWMYVQANAGGSILQDIRDGKVEAASAAHSIWLVVTAGDYFEINFAQNSGGNLNLAGASGVLAQATRAQFEWMR